MATFSTQFHASFFLDMIITGEVRALVVEWPIAPASYATKGYGSGILES
jgi:hypothetical protein